MTTGLEPRSIRVDKCKDSATVRVQKGGTPRDDFTTLLSSVAEKKFKKKKLSPKPPKFYVVYGKERIDR